MRTSTSGLLLLLVGVTLLAGFLTGNLDRWIAYLFDPGRPSLASLATAGVGPTGSPVSSPTAIANRRAAGGTF